MYSRQLKRRWHQPKDSSLPRGAPAKRAARAEAIRASTRYQRQITTQPESCDERGVELKQVFADRWKLIRTTLEIKLAFHKSINELLTRKDELTTAERDEAEVAADRSQQTRTGMLKPRQPGGC